MQRFFTLTAPAMESHAPYTPDLDVESLLGRAWQRFKDNAGVLVLATLFVFVVSSLSNVVSYVYEDETVAACLGSIIYYVILLALGAGLNWLCLLVARHGTASFERVFDGFRRFGRVVGYQLLYSIAVGVGLLLLVVPGVFLMLALFPVTFLVLDGDDGVEETFRHAWRMTEGYRGRILLLYLVVFGLNLLGFLALCVGVLVTAPLSYVMLALVYEELRLAYPERVSADPEA